MGPDPKDKLKSPKLLDRKRQELEELHARTKRLLAELDDLMEKSRQIVLESAELIRQRHKK